MRHVTALLLLVHGTVSMLGFLSAFKLAAVPGLRGQTLWPLGADWHRALGFGWLLVALGLLLAAFLRWRDVGAWWLVAGAAVLLSQALIVVHWPEAKAGTLVNVLLAIAVVFAAARERFEVAGRRQAEGLLGPAAAAPTILTPADVANLPSPVRRWLLSTGAVGRPRVLTVRLRQSGGLRTRPEQSPMPAVATQYFRVHPPGFVWLVDVTMKRLPVLGRDDFDEGTGRMLITLGGLVPIVNATGEGIDRGAALRFLGELVWFPSAATSPAISWEPIDSDSARATLHAKGFDVSAVFTFDASGRFTQLRARRSYDGGPEETWRVDAHEWGAPRGVKVPVAGSVVWALPAGDFEYYRWRIHDVEENPAGLWPPES